VRYYFGTTQALGNYVMRCYSAAIDNPYTTIACSASGGTPPASDIQFAFGQTHSATTGAMNYLEISFPTGAPSVPTADGTATIQVEFDNGSYSSNFTPTSDYSYQVGDGGYSPNTHITATLAGTLAWGVLP